MSGRRPEHTMLIKAPVAPPKSTRPWRPFNFTNLEKVSKRDVSLVRNVEWLVPNVHGVGDISQAVTERLKEMLEEPVSLQTEYVHVVPMSRLKHYVGSPTFLAVLAPQPNKTRGLLEVELGLAHHAIDALLGGAGESVALRPLTDIEEGVMTYVVIEALKALSPGLDSSLPKLRIEGLVRGYDEVQSLIPESDKLAVVQLKAVFGAHAGYVRVIIPEDILASAEPAAESSARRARVAHEVELHGKRLSHVPVTLRAEIGTMEITAGDLEQLRERDVVLVDALSCRPNFGEPGTAKVRVGAGRTGHIDCDVVFADNKTTLTVTGFSPGSAPTPALDEGGPAELVAPAAPVGEDDDESTSPYAQRGRDDVDDAQSAVGAEIMNDIPLQIAVELGRVAVNAEEVVGLKVGHVFDLNRVAGEPLDLSVNGKIVARGELVEVDGNLGVRILSLAG